MVAVCALSYGAPRTSLSMAGRVPPEDSGGGEAVPPGILLGLCLGTSTFSHVPRHARPAELLSPGLLAHVNESLLTRGARNVHMQ